jgi:hypothetical protein
LGGKSGYSSFINDTNYFIANPLSYPYGDGGAGACAGRDGYVRVYYIT